MNDTPLLKTPGELIGEARRACDMSLEDLSRLTRIPPPVIEALERDEYHRVSGALYIKSFLRSCAVELKLDPDLLLDLYSRFSGEAKSIGGDPVWEDEEVRVTRVGFPWVRLVLALLVAAATLVGVGLILRGCGGSDGDPANTEAVTETVAASDTSAGGALSVVTDSMRTTSRETIRTIRPEPAVAGADNAVEPPPVRRDPPAQSSPVRDLSDLPTARPSDPTMVFEGGARWPVVMRVICSEPVGIRVRRDGEDDRQRAVWPTAGDAAPALPAGEIRAGRAYAVREGMAVYWGASDNISVWLDRTDDVRLSGNGVPRDLAGLAPGQELVIYLPSSR